MAELNFKIDQTALQKIQETELTANFEEMEEALTEFVKPYESLIVTEDAIGLAKGDRAKLRSVAKHIDDYRKLVKRTYTEPLKAFEDKCKSLTGIIDKGVANLDSQVKLFEERRREEKMFLLRDYFDNAKAGLKYPEYADWEVILNEKWGNVTFDIEQAKRDIDLACFNVDHDVQSLMDLHSEFEVALLDNYKKSHLLYETLKMNDRLVEDKKRQEERQKQLEEQYKRQRAEREAREMAAKVVEQTNPTPKVEEPEQMYIATFKVHGTYDEIRATQHFMNINKISHLFEGMAKTDKPAEAVLG